MVHYRTAMRRICFAFCVVFPLFLAAFTVRAGADDRPHHAVADQFVPVLNTPDLGSIFGGKDGKTLALDQCGQIRAIEFIALPGTTFSIDGIINDFGFPVYRVTTPDYPYPSANGYYIDSRLVRTTAKTPPPRTRSLPSPAKIISRLESATGTPYRWGSNRRQGIPALLALYPPATDYKPSAAVRNTWTLTGLDCSGLLYEATDGWTPRNTSTLVGYGTSVAIAGLDAERIVRIVKPLDIIVWKGHVMIVLDRDRLIESRLDCAGKGGVRIRNLKEGLRQLLAARIPLDEYEEHLPEGTKGFVIRRWHPEVMSGTRNDIGK